MNSCQSWAACRANAACTCESVQSEMCTWPSISAGVRLNHWIAHELQPRCTLLEGMIWP